jgi:GTPase SAR1 family protein
VLLRVVRCLIAAIIVYDITNHVSFDNVDMWMRDFREHCPEAVIVLVGNKVRVPEPSACS